MRSILKKVLSVDNVQKIQSSVEQLDLFILPFFAKSRFLSSFYYCFFSRRFSREHQSVIKGRLAYLHNLSSADNSNVMLRRNIHRLEKGLIMRPQREIFGEAYITETVNFFSKCYSKELDSSEEVKWAKEVLTRYFSLVSSSSEIIEAAKINFFDALGSNELSDEELESVPYLHQDIVNSDVDFEQFKQLCIQRRSVRWFKDEHVPRELIEKALSAATLAPSACNRQPFEFYIFNEPTEAREIGSIPMGTAGFSHNFQCTIVVVGDLASYPYERDRHVIYIDGSLAVMQLILALETLGLSSCVINWPDVEILENKMARKLNLTENERPLMVLSIGYADPDGKIPFSQKKNCKELIKDITK